MAADLENREIAHQVVKALGVRAADLQGPLTVPTLAVFLPKVIASASPSARNAYGTYWSRAVERFGSQTLDELRASDISVFRQDMIRNARKRRNSRQGRYAGENAVRAMRRIYRLAVADGYIRREDNPAAQVSFPRRTRSTREGLSREQIAEIDHVVRSTGNDPVLDSLLLRLHLETACRRGGALGLRVSDLDTSYCRVLLRERAVLNAGNPSHRPWQQRSPGMLHTAAPVVPMTRCCAIATTAH